MSKWSRTLASLLAVSLLVVAGCAGKDTNAPNPTNPVTTDPAKAPDPVTLKGGC